MNWILIANTTQTIVDYSTWIKIIFVLSIMIFVMKKIMDSWDKETDS